MKIIAWNINGMKAMVGKNDLFNMVEKEKPDIICFGETKLTCSSDFVSEKKCKSKHTCMINSTTNIIDSHIDMKYKYYSQCIKKKGYSGTAIFSKKEPLSVKYGIGHNDMDNEGRVITLEFRKFFLIHVYTPNSGELLARLDYRVNKWDVKFMEYLKKLQNEKNIIVCGDLNVANEDIDIHDPKHNKKTAGFTDDERNSFKKILSEVNLVDTYRYMHPKKIEYSYWSYRRMSREKNKGWRIDYFLVSHDMISKVKKASILTNVYGSDHAPVKINILL